MKKLLIIMISAFMSLGAFADTCPLTVHFKISTQASVPQAYFDQLKTNFENLGYIVTSDRNAYFQYTIQQRNAERAFRLDNSLDKQNGSHVMYSVYAEGGFMDIFPIPNSNKSWRKRANKIMRRIGKCGSEMTLVGSDNSVIKTIKFY